MSWLSDQAAKAKAAAQAAAAKIAQAQAMALAAAQATAKKVADAAAAAKAAATKAAADLAAKLKADAQAVINAKAAADAQAKAAADAKAKAAAVAAQQAAAAAAKKIADANAAAAAQLKWQQDEAARLREVQAVKERDAALAAAAAIAAEKQRIADAQAAALAQQTLAQKVSTGVGTSIGLTLGAVQSVANTIGSYVAPEPITNTGNVLQVAPPPASMVTAPATSFVSGLTQGAAISQEVKPIEQIIEKTPEVITYIPNKITEVLTYPITPSQNVVDYSQNILVPSMETPRSDTGTVTFVTPMENAPESIQLQDQLKRDLDVQQILQTEALESNIGSLTGDAQAQLSIKAEDIMGNLQESVNAGDISPEKAQAVFDAQIAAEQAKIQAQLDKDIAAEQAAADVRLKAAYTSIQAEAIPQIEYQQQLEQKSNVGAAIVGGAVRGLTYSVPVVGQAVLAADIAETAKSIPTEIAFLKTGGKEAIGAELQSLAGMTVGLGIGGAAGTALFGSPTTTLKTESPAIGSSSYKLPPSVAEIKAQELRDYGLLGKTDYKTDAELINAVRSDVSLTQPLRLPPTPSELMKQAELNNFGLLGKADIKTDAQILEAARPTLQSIYGKTTEGEILAGMETKILEKATAKVDATLQSQGIKITDPTSYNWLVGQEAARMRVANMDELAKAKTLNQAEISFWKTPTQTEPIYNVLNRGMSEIQVESLSRFTKTQEQLRMDRAREAALKRTEPSTIEFWKPEAERAAQQQLNRLRSGADVFAVDLKTGKAQFRPSESPFGMKETPEVLQSFDKSIKKEASISEIQQLALKRLKEAQAANPFVIPRETGKRSLAERTIKFKAEEPTIPKGYKAAPSSGGMIMLMKEEVKTIPKKVQLSDIQKLSLSRLKKSQEQPIFRILTLEQQAKAKFRAGLKQRVAQPEALLAFDNIIGLKQQTRAQWEKQQIEKPYWVTQASRTFVVPQGRFSQVSQVLARPMQSGRITQLMRTETKMKQRMKQEEALKGGSALGLRSIEQSQKMLSLQKPQQKMMYQQMQQLKFKEQQLQKMQMKQLQFIGMASAQTQRMRQNQQQNLRQNMMQRQRVRSALELPKIKLKLKIPEQNQVNIFKKSLKPSMPKAFDVQIKRKGKWNPLGVALTESQASKLAQMRLKKSLAASARLVPTRKALQKSNIQFIPKPGEFRQYKVSKGRKIFDPRLFIQEVGSKKKGFSRLGSKEEVSEIKRLRQAKIGKIKW